MAPLRLMLFKVILELTAAESNQNMTYSTVVKDDGTWSMPPASFAGDLDGSYSIYLRAVDENDIDIATRMLK